MPGNILFNTIMPRKNNNKKKVGKGSQKRAIPRQIAVVSLDNQATMYRALLRDPCNGPMVPAVGPGPASGLLVRQRYYVNISVGTPQSVSDFVCVFQPAKGILRYRVSTNNQWIEKDLETGILASNLCRAYRPVAACMKWIPTGPVMERSGLISTGYVLDEVDTTTAVSTDVERWMTLCTKTVSNTGNGSIPEVRWIPSGPEDVEFRTQNVTYNADTGTSLLVGRSIDFASGTISYCNGTIEVTVVWEWVPHAGSGVVAPIQAGSRNTMQQVLGSVGNLMSFVLDDGPMQRLVGAAMGGVMQRVFNGRAGPPLIMR